MSTAQRARVRVGLVGAGNMGANHARILSEQAGVEFVGLVEPNAERANEIAERFGCKAFADISDLVGKVDAVTIAAPSTSHAETGSYLLSNGIPCLIEKPLATTAADCERLIAAAEAKGVPLMVGHVERFNPAVRQLSSILAQDHHLYAVDTRRLSATSARIHDVDVVLDLMIHDIDVVLSLWRRKVTGITARGVSIEPATRGMDYVTALLSFEGGGFASLTASRITQNKVRELTISSDLGHIALDYSTQTLMIYKQQTGLAALRSAALGSYSLDLSMERVLVRPAEPLVLEVQHFVACVRNASAPEVDGRQALQALEIVWQIQALARGEHGLDQR